MHYHDYPAQGLHAHESSPLFILTGQAYSALLYSTSLPAFRNYLHMKVIRHAGVDSRMIILDDQARQKMTLHLEQLGQLEVKSHLLACLIVQNNHPTTYTCIRT